MVAASSLAEANGHHTSAEGLKKAGGVFCFPAGLVGWYLTFQLFLKDSLVELLLGDTSGYFGKSRKKEQGLCGKTQSYLGSSSACAKRLLNFIS